MTDAEFRALKVIYSCHYGLMTFIPLSENSAEIGDGTEDIDRFDPGPSFSWDWTLDAAVKLNAQAALITTKHCDGMMLNRSALGHSAGDTTWGAANPDRDLLTEFVEGCRERHLKVIFYFAVGDNYLTVQNGGYGGTYVSDTLAQLTELLTNYGDVAAMILDAWGDFWTTPPLSGFPDFGDIPHDTIYDHIKSIQPGCLVIINNHDEVSGDVNLWEETVTGEPKSGAARATLLWRVIFRHAASVVQRWFDHIDREHEPLQPAVRTAALAQHRMIRRRYPIAHNIPCGPDGRITLDVADIIEALADTEVPRIWSGLEAYWPMDEFNGSDAAVEEVHQKGQYPTPLTVVGTCAGVAGKLGGARSFSSGNYMKYEQSVPAVNRLSLGDRSFTWTGWTSLSAISNGLYPFIFAKDYNGGGPGIEYALGIDTPGGGVFQPQFYVSGDGTVREEVNATDYNVVANTPFFFVCGHDALRDRIFIQINDNAMWYTDWGGGVAESVWLFTVGARGNGGGQPMSGWVDSLMLFMGRTVTHDEAVEMYNGGVGLSPWPTVYDQNTDASFNDVPQTTMSPLMVHVFGSDTSSSTGAGKTGLVYSDFTAKYLPRGQKLRTLTTEDISSLGVYEEPTDATHIRIHQVNQNDPTKGIYEVHLHPLQVTDFHSILLCLSASGAQFQPLEIMLENKVTHVRNAKLTERDIGATVLARLQSVMGSQSTAKRLLNFDDETRDATLDTVLAGNHDVPGSAGDILQMVGETSVGGGGATAAEIWAYPTRILTAGTNITLPTGAITSASVTSAAALKIGSASCLGSGTVLSVTGTHLVLLFNGADFGQGIAGSDWSGCEIVFQDVNGESTTVSRTITATNVDGEIDVDATLPVDIDAGDKFRIYPGRHAPVDATGGGLTQADVEDAMTNVLNSYTFELDVVPVAAEVVSQIQTAIEAGQMQLDTVGLDNFRVWCSQNTGGKTMTDMTTPKDVLVTLN